jgi:hypothetical protein
MSDNYVIVIPDLPNFVPNQINQSKGISYFRSIAPLETDIKTLVNNQIHFIDCGENFENIKCPFCSTNISIETWQSWMGMDFDGKGFILNWHKMPCCAANLTLHELNYSFPQGFARFQLIAMNPNIGRLSENQLAKFAQILECPIRVIYKRI